MLANCCLFKFFVARILSSSRNIYPILRRANYARNFASDYVYAVIACVFINVILRYFLLIYCSVFEYDFSANQQ